MTGEAGGGDDGWEDVRLEVRGVLEVVWDVMIVVVVLVGGRERV